MIEFIDNRLWFWLLTSICMGILCIASLMLAVLGHVFKSEGQEKFAFLSTLIIAVMSFVLFLIGLFIRAWG